MSLATTEAPAAPATETASAAQVTPEVRSGNASSASRPAGAENISGADLRAVLVKNRQARRSSASAPRSNVQGTPAKPAAEPAPASSTEAGETADPTSHATSTPEGSSDDVLSTLTQPAVPAVDTEPETPPETPPATQAAAEPEVDLEAVLDNPESLSEDAIKGIKDKAIRRLVGRIHKLTARLREGEQRQQTPAEPETAPTQTGDPELSQLGQRISLIQEAMDWARTNRDGGEFVTKDGKVRGNYTADQVDQILANAPAQLADLSARKAVREESVRLRDQQAAAAAMDSAVKAYPWLRNPESEEHGQALAILQQAPYLRQHPEWPMWLADAIAGRKARLASATAPALRTNTARPVPPKIPQPAAAAAPRVDPATKAIREAEAAYEKSGSQDDLKRMEALKRQARRRA